jgi:hypothetical protein
MNKALRYALGILGAVFAAVILEVLMHDEFNIAQNAIVLGSLASAGMLSLLCAASALISAMVRARK